MTVHITGTVVNPDGSPFDGVLLLVPTSWRADEEPVPALMTDRRVTSPIKDGVVDAEVDSDPSVPWDMTVTSLDGRTHLSGRVLLPESGEVRIDQLAPAPDINVAVYPNPGPAGPPGDGHVDLGPLSLRVAATEDKNTAQDDQIAEIIAGTTEAFASANARITTVEGVATAANDRAVEAKVKNSTQDDAIAAVNVRVDGIVPLPAIEAANKPGEVLALDSAGEPGWSGAVVQVNDSLGDLSGLHVYGGMDGFIDATEAQFDKILGHAPPTIEATLQVDKYGGSFVRVMTDAVLGDNAEHWVQFAMATTAGPNGEVFTHTNQIASMSGNAWFDNSGSLGNVLGSNNQGVSNMTLSNYIKNTRICRVKRDVTTDPTHPKLIVLEAVPSDPAQTVLVLDSLADVSVSGANTPNNGDVLTLTANGWKGRPAELDTGLRDISSLVSAAHKAANPNVKLYAQRQGQTVTLFYSSGASPTASGLVTVCDAIPSGFRFTAFGGERTAFSILMDAASGGASNVSFYTSAAATITSGVQVSGTPYRGHLMYPTSDPWPTTLPGTQV